MTNTKFKENRSRSSLLRLILCLLMISLGVAGFISLKKMKKAPPQVVHKERPIKVEVEIVQKENVAVQISGNGELKSVRTLDMAAEVSGRIVTLHENLAVGRIIKKGELLFAIDESDYQADYQMNRARLDILKRDKVLANKEFERISTLFAKNRVGTEAGVEGAEKNANSVSDRLAQVEQAMKRARNNLARCRLYAPYTCRIVTKNIEIGQYVTPGKMLLSLADDSMLEMTVAVDSRDALQWLEFDATGDRESGGGWFAPVKRVAVQLHWTEAPAVSIEAVLDRVGLFNARTRSVELIIQLDTEKGERLAAGFPLVAGMFCSVEIPGKVMTDVISLPRWAVSFDKNVYVVKNNRLVTTPVQLARIQGGRAYVSDGLLPGDTVITTRLANPLEQALVEVVDGSRGDK